MGLKEFGEQIGKYSDFIEQIEVGGSVIRNFRVTESEQFFGRQIGLMAVRGRLEVETASHKKNCSCICCFNADSDLELLVLGGNVLQSEDDSRVLLIENGSVSISGSRNYSAARPEGETLPIGDPERLCLDGSVSKTPGTVLAGGVEFAVLLGACPGAEIIERLESAECHNRQSGKSHN